MYAYGNHIRVKSAKVNLVIMDSRVAATFTTMCKSMDIQNNNLIKVDLEYVGWVEEILKLDYGTTCVIALSCN